MSSRIDITDGDIDNIESYLRTYFPCDFGSGNTRDALKCTQSRDIQAGPGSGKTTVLVAKLAILSGKCEWRDKGLLVLSHTNAAREEIITRLGSHSSACRLLDYPHFVGTIQSFVDRFLALPYLRNKGIHVHAIDDRVFAIRARARIGAHVQANAWLKNHPNRDYLGTLRYEGPELGIGSAAGQFNLSPSTATYRQLVTLKQGVSEKDGVFRFDDMYAFAEAYLTESPLLVNALRTRFNWVFVDEMQDTSALQEKILDRLFGQDCIVQRFGDVNQAIYWENSAGENQNSFPRDGAIDLLESKRFGKEIADAATNLTSSRRQSIQGNAPTPGKKVLFAFDNRSIGNVIAAFGDYILEQHAGEVPKRFIVKAVGFRKAGGNTDPDKVPFSVSDYWSGFEPDLTQGSNAPNSLIGYVVKAISVRDKTGELAESYSTLLSGVRRFLHIQGASDTDGHRLTESRLIGEMRSLGQLEKLQMFVAGACLQRMPLDEASWQGIAGELCEVTKKWTGATLSDEASAFLKWEPAIHQPTARNASPRRANVIPHKGLDIEVGTIHSVKGQTHSATLVLETYLNKKHDLQSLLPYIKGRSAPSDPSVGHTVKEHAKRIFVGATRPREILALAIHRNHLTDEDIAELRSLGWAVKDLTRGNAPGSTATVL